MGAFESLIQSLIAEQGAPDYSAGDSYREPAQIADALGSIILKERDNFGTGEAMAGALITGLLGGGFEQASTDYQNRQKKNYQDVLVSKYLGGGGVKPDDMEQSLFDVAGERGNVLNMLKQNEQALLQQDYDSKRAGKLEDVLLERGVVVDADGKVQRLFDPAKDKSNEEAATVTAKLKAENDFWNQSQGEGAPLVNTNPDSPQYKVNKDNDEKLVTLRKEFNALDPVKNFAKASQAATAISGALKDLGRVSDQELVRYSIQMIEPGMAVREGEQNAVASSQTIPEEWKGQVNAALSGGTGLGPEVREGIKRLAARAYSSHKRLYDQAFDLYGKEATMQGADPSRLSYIGEAPGEEEVFGTTAGTSPTSPIAGMAGPELQSAIEAEVQRRAASRGQRGPMTQMFLQQGG